MKSRYWLVMAALVAFCGHMTLAAYFVDPRLLFADEPLNGADFDTHIGQTYRVLEGLEGWGKPWVYDVQLLAGQPEGTIFDADNKGWEFWTYLLHKCGFSKAHAFNAFVLVAHALVPCVVAAAAAVMGLSPWAVLSAGVMASTIWFFDSWAHWTWWIGMVAYALASASFLFPLALFQRFLSRRSRASGALFVPVLALCHLLHPYSFFMLAAPLASMYLRQRRSLLRVDHAFVLAAIFATFALNSLWLVPAIKHWHYILTSDFFGRTGIQHLLADFMGLLLDPSDSGVIATRTAFRFLYLGLSVAAVVVAGRARDARTLGISVALVNLIVLGYFGSYLPGGNQIQPYRHVLPLSFACCLGAALFVDQLLASHESIAPNSLSRGLLAVCAIGLCQYLAQNVMYFTPEWLPRVRKMIDGTDAPLAALGHPPFPSYRIPREVDHWVRLGEMSDWMVRNIPVDERVLVEETHLGERVAWKTGLEVIGGFRHRNIEHSRANLFRTHEDAAMEPALLAEYLRTYAVRWIIALKPRVDLEQASSLLERQGPVEGRVVYRSRVAYSKTLVGAGAVSARTNRIDVRGSQPGEPLVLSYHFHEKLVCQPGCRVVREPVAFDKVGLIRVLAPHPIDIQISLQY